MWIWFCWIQSWQPGKQKSYDRPATRLEKYLKHSNCHTSFVSVEKTIEEELLVLLVDNFDDLSTKDLKREWIDQKIAKLPLNLIYIVFLEEIKSFLKIFASASSCWRFCDDMHGKSRHPKCSTGATLWLSLEPHPSPCRRTLRRFSQSFTSLVFIGRCTRNG